MKGSNIINMRLTNAIYMNETFDSYNTRRGLSGRAALVPIMWTNVQNDMVTTSLKAWTDASNQLALAMAQSVTNSSIDTNSIVLPPVYKAVAIPTFLRALGAN